MDHERARLGAGTVSTARCRRLLVLLLLGTLVGCGAQVEPEPEEETPAGEAAQEAEIEAVQADIRKIQTALFSGDVKTVLALTNPDALAALGSDPADAAAAIEQGMSVLQNGDVELELLTFPDDPTFFSGTEHDFVLVPTLSAYKLGGLRIESRGFSLGIRPRGGGKWTYVEGEQFEDENVQQLFPDFPMDQPLPDTHKRRL
jgi:hypothetical protein